MCSYHLQYCTFLTTATLITLGISHSRRAYKTPSRCRRQNRFCVGPIPAGILIAAITNQNSIRRRTAADAHWQNWFSYTPSPDSVRFITSFRQISRSRRPNGVTMSDRISHMILHSANYNVQSPRIVRQDIVCARQPGVTFPHSYRKQKEHAPLQSAARFWQRTT